MILIPDLFGAYVKGQEEAIKANWTDLENFDAVSKTMRENALGDATHEGNLADAGLANILSTTRYRVADSRRGEIATLLGNTADYNLNQQGYNVNKATGILGADVARLPNDIDVYAGGQTTNNALATYNQGNAVPNAVLGQKGIVAASGANIAASNTAKVAAENQAIQIPKDQAFADVTRGVTLTQQDEGSDQYSQQLVQQAQQRVENKRIEIQNAQIAIADLARSGLPGIETIIKTQTQAVGLMVQDLQRLQITLQQLRAKPATPSAQQQYTNLLGN